MSTVYQAMRSMHTNLSKIPTIEKQNDISSRSRDDSDKVSTLELSLGQGDRETTITVPCDKHPLGEYTEHYCLGRWPDLSIFNTTMWVKIYAKGRLTNSSLPLEMDRCNQAGKQYFFQGLKRVGILYS